VRQTGRFLRDLLRPVRIRDGDARQPELGVEAAGIELGELVDQVAVAGGFELDFGAGMELDKGKLALVVHGDGGDLVQRDGPGLL
jgi:hypothetical protein